MTTILLCSLLATASPEVPPLDTAHTAVLAADLVTALEASRRAHEQDPTQRAPLELLLAIHVATGNTRPAEALRARLAALPGPPPAVAPPEAAHVIQPGPAWVAATRLNVRPRPAPGGRAVRELVMGTPVTVLAVQGEWAELAAEGKQRGGFVATRMLAASPVTVESLARAATAMEATGNAAAALTAWERVLAFAPAHPQAARRVAALAVATRNYPPAVRAALLNPAVVMPPDAVRPLGMGCDSAVQAARFPEIARSLKAAARLQSDAATCATSWSELSHRVSAFPSRGAGDGPRLQERLCDSSLGLERCMEPISGACEQDGLTIHPVAQAHLQAVFAQACWRAASMDQESPACPSLPAAFQSDASVRAWLSLLAVGGPRSEAALARARERLAEMRHATCACSGAAEAREAAGRVDLEVLSMDARPAALATAREWAAMLRAWPTAACPAPANSQPPPARGDGGMAPPR